MTTHTLVATTWPNALGSFEPVLHCTSGDVVITETLDAGGVDRDGVARAPTPMNRDRDLE